MEENKGFMPPPPPKELRNMPPPPPPRSDQQEEEVKNKPVEFPKEEIVQHENAQVQIENKSKEKVEKEKKQKSSGGMKTVLYWVGFDVSLAAIGVFVFMLVKPF